MGAACGVDVSFWEAIVDDDLADHCNEAIEVFSCGDAGAVSLVGDSAFLLGGGGEFSRLPEVHDCLCHHAVKSINIHAHNGSQSVRWNS